MAPRLTLLAKGPARLTRAPRASASLPDLISARRASTAQAPGFARRQREAVARSEQHRAARPNARQEGKARSYKVKPPVKTRNELVGFARRQREAVARSEEHRAARLARQEGKARSYKVKPPVKARNGLVPAPAPQPSDAWAARVQRAVGLDAVPKTVKGQGKVEMTTTATTTKTAAAATSGTQTKMSGREATSGMTKGKTKRPKRDASSPDWRSDEEHAAMKEAKATAERTKLVEKMKARHGDSWEKALQEIDEQRQRQRRAASHGSIPSMETKPPVPSAEDRVTARNHA